MYLFIYKAELLEQHLKLKQKINQLADQCVKCGMCLPTCPTYKVSKNESESPRGRIALMQGIVNGDLPLNSKVTKHLDHCVSCLSCENICPSTVQYETLIDSIREYTAINTNNKKTGKIISLLLAPLVKNTLFGVMRLYQGSGLQFLFRSSGILKPLGLKEKDKLLPKLSSRLKLKPLYKTQQQSALGTVALFTGCMGDIFEQNTIQASITVLNALGFNVAIPKQVCCGALHQHSGYPTQAESFATVNRRSLLSADKYVAILFTASGCGTQLKSSLKQASIPVHSIMQFVSLYIHKNTLTLKPVQQHVAIHQPCSLKNSLHEEQAVIEILSAIPQLRITELQAECCGAAGKNMLTQPQLAAQIRQPIIEQIDKFSPNLLVSSNIGCALHLKSAISDNIPLIHPVELLAKSFE